MLFDFENIQKCSANSKIFLGIKWFKCKGQLAYGDCGSNSNYYSSILIIFGNRFSCGYILGIHTGVEIKYTEVRVYLIL